MDKISKIKTDLLMREWAEMVRECRSSGLTVKEWCINNDVNIKTYYYRLKRVRDLPQKDEWENLCCIGGINKKVKTENGKTDEWYYYISSRLLTPEELLHHARMEWSVETMHWLLDVHFDEDHCRAQDKNVQLNLNIARKCAINLIKLFKSETGSRKPISNIMLDCLVDERDLLQIVDRN